MIFEVTKKMQHPPPQKNFFVSHMGCLLKKKKKKRLEKYKEPSDLTNSDREVSIMIEDYCVVLTGKHLG